MVGQSDAPLFGAMARATEPRVNKFNAREIASTAWAFAIMGASTDSLFSVLARAAEARMVDFKQQELVDTAWAFAKALRPDQYQSLTAALGRTVLQSVGDLNRTDLVDLGWAFSMLQLSDNGTLLAAMNRRISECQLLEMMRPGQVGAIESEMGKDGTVSRLSWRPHPNDRQTSIVRLVSLGAYCGVKYSFQKIGRREATLPFDWIRTRIEGLMNFITHNFDGYLHFCSTAYVIGPENTMRIWRARTHSFWHDDPRAPSTREKYLRRFARFQAIDARSAPVLFVRAMFVHSEIEYLPTVLSELMDRFGSKVHLLAIVDHNGTLEGAVTVRSHPRLLFFYHPWIEGEFAPYKKAVMTGLDWVVGRLQRCTRFENLEQAMRWMKPMDLLDDWEKKNNLTWCDGELHTTYTGQFRDLDYNMPDEVIYVSEERKDQMEGWYLH